MNAVDTILALLFVSDSPCTVEQLVLASGLAEGQTAQALEILEARLDEKGPIQLMRLAGGYQLCTKPEFDEPIARLLRPQGNRLTRSLLEVLAVVAYKQPITIAELEQVRGVQCDYSIRSLIEKKLVEEVGRKQTPGRPILYGTTPNFLHQFKLDSLNDLPPINPDDTGKVVTLFEQGL